MDSVQIILYIVLLMATATIHHNGIADGQDSEYLGGKKRNVLSNKYNVCRTKECIITAKRLKRNMDLSVNPCDDFYSFACGNFVKNEKIPKDKLASSYFHKVNDKVKKEILPLLKQPPKGFNDIRPFKMVRYSYKTCLNEYVIDARGIEFLLDTLKDSGGWPVLEGEEWDVDNFNWVDTVYMLQDHYLSGDFVGIRIEADYKNSFKNVIQLLQPDLGLDKAYLDKGREEKVVEAYGSYMADIAIMFGADHKYAVEEMSKVLDFEIELSAISLKPEELRDHNKMNNPMTIKMLQKRYPFVNWMEYLTTTLNSAVFNSRDVVIVLTPTYFTKLQNLLKRSDKRTIANYMFWRAVMETLNLLPKTIRDRSLEYFKILNGIKTHKPRWEVCLINTITRFPLAISALYVKNFFSEDSKNSVLGIVERFRKEMISILKNVDWMDIDTRQKALDKLNTMHKRVGYPNEILDENKIEEYYTELDITGDEYFESVMKINKFYFNYYVKKLFEKNNKTDWRSFADLVEVNAFYSPPDNSIYLPAAILQSPFFSTNRPKYMNYAAIGLVIGHEITHAFDDQGRRLDKFGNLVDWWKPKTAKEFKKRMQCVIDKANNYTIKAVNMKLNGPNTQGENIADIGGMKVATLAYNSWLADHYEEPRLVGFEKYSPKQMFWISSAEIWCTVTRPENLLILIMLDPHAPVEFRVNSFVSNHEQFGKDFNCPIGSKMNPIKKCKLW